MYTVKDLTWIIRHRSPSGARMGQYLTELDVEPDLELELREIPSGSSTTTFATFTTLICFQIPINYFSHKFTSLEIHQTLNLSREFIRDAILNRSKF